jgi:PAS domain S-box-containing protein
VDEGLHIIVERGRAADILREHRARVVAGWMRKVRLLNHERAPQDAIAEADLRENGQVILETLLSRLDGGERRGEPADLYELILEGRREGIRLADVAYILLELKSIAKRVIFESIGDELQAFRVSRVVDDAVEALLRKSADLYEVASEADQQIAGERLQEVYAAWDLEEALVSARDSAEVCRWAIDKLGAIWELADWQLSLCERREDEAEFLNDACEQPMPLVAEQRQYTTGAEHAQGDVVPAMESVMRRRDVWVCEDAACDERLANAEDVTAAGTGSLACVPLVSGDLVTGAMLLFARSAGTFRAADARRLRDLGAVVALALDRTTRVERSRKQISEREVIARIGRSLLELPTHEELLQGVVDALRAFRDYFDVSLFRVDEEAGECVLVAEAGKGRRYRPDAYRQQIGSGFIGLCARNGKTIRAADLLSDSRRYIAFEEEYRARCELAVPVSSGDRVLGVLHLLSEKDDDFPDSDLAALEQVAPHIGVALQNASMLAARRHDRYEIQQAHQHLANIIRSTAVGITSCDANGVYTHWSPSCEDLLGYTQEEVVGRMTPADLAAKPYDLQEALEDCRRMGRTSSEHAVLCKDGTARTVREIRVPMEDERGDHVGFTAYLVDVTEQKEAEERLRRERDTLDLVVGAMGAGLALYDRSLNLQWANPTLMDWLGFGADAFGRSCHDVCVFGYCRTGPCPIIEADRTGVPQSRTYELTDAAGVWHCYQQLFTPVSESDTRLVVLTLDITDQRRQTEQMRLINRLTEKVDTTLDLEKVLHLVLTCVTAGHAIGLNRAFIFLVDDGEEYLQGRMAVGPVSLEDAQRIWEDLAAERSSMDDLLGRGGPSPSDRRLTEEVRHLRIPLANEKDTLVSTFLSWTGAHVGDARSDPHMDGDLQRALGLEEFACVPLAAPDRPLGVLVGDHKFTRNPIGEEQVQLLELFSRQASLAIANALAYERIRVQLQELQQTRDRLIESERMASVGRMASHLAHEIRNPLTVIGGFATSIARQYQDDPKTHRNAMIIYEETRRLERALVNVLDYTRPLNPRKQRVDLNKLVRETLMQFEGQLRDQGITLRMAMDDGLSEVPADAGMIKQVIINLVKNGLEAMEQKDTGTLSVATAPSEDHAELMIGDTGTGMSAETAAQLFSPFYTTKIGGVGLGLTISRRIVSQHGGQMEASSKLGVGSTFTVKLPLSEPAGTVEPHGIPSEAHG